jgi:hypothetical protein
MPTHRHHLNCMRAGCGRPFSSTRSDAQYCSRRCRRDKLPATPVRAAAALPIGNGDTPAITSEALASLEDDGLDGWRRVPGGYVIPPPDRRFTFTPGDLGGL